MYQVILIIINYIAGIYCGYNVAKIKQSKECIKCLERLDAEFEDLINEP